MKNLEGMKWNELTVAQQKELLSMANAIDAETGNDIEEGECVIDLTEEYSVAGEVVGGELIIDDEAIIYNPAN